MAICSSCGKENPEGFQFCGFCTQPLALAPPVREQRKVVTILFCDVTGSTELGEQLDPETLRGLIARYFERMKAIVEAHGGTVEKFIGDAVMAVFGIPTVHEDDALRACRAAVEMRAALPELGIEGRIGVATGEVVTGTEERLATGDAVNIAARLEQVAEPGEVVISDATLRLVRDAVEVDWVEPLALKGKTKPVPAHRLLSVRAGATSIERHLELPMVGRSEELDDLSRGHKRSVTERSCHLFTVLGPAGVGKSRLVKEFLSQVGDETIVRGRCLPYGEGITYWPVVEVVKQLDALPSDETAASAIRLLLGEAQAVTSPEEIAWAFRKALEEAAQERPVVCVFDDIHWGEETFLDLVEHVADLARDAPIFLLCMARPELLDRRPGWSGGKMNATTALLEPLRPEETDRLIDGLAVLDDSLRVRIREAAEGNPLFVEEMVALLQESGDGHVAVPPTIHALLAARLDQLDPHERNLLQFGSVEGRVFHRGAVAALAPAEPQISVRLTSLVRKELVRPDKAQFTGDDAFRFRHLLIRDAAYDSLPKANRAESHECFADWLLERGHDLVELEEILGYHLEQAWRARMELGLADARTEALGRRAAGYLSASGRRALQRADMPSAGNLLRRAIALLPVEDSARTELLPDVAFAAFETGEIDDALELVTEAIDRAGDAGLSGVRSQATVLHSFWRLLLHPREVDLEALEDELQHLIPVFEELRDDLGLARAWNLLWDLRHLQGQTDKQVEIAERAVDFSRRAESPQDHTWALGNLCWAVADGDLPVSKGIEVCGQHLERATNRANRAILEAFMAYLRALEGDFRAAREHMLRSGDVVEFGHPFHTGVVQLMWGRIESLAGEPAAAEAALRPAWEGFVETGDGWFAPIAAVDLSRAVLTQGRAAEAFDILATIDEASVAPDPEIIIKRRAALGRILAQLGRLEDALEASQDAVSVAARSPFPVFRADALLDRVEVLRQTGSSGEVERLLEEALTLYSAKGAIVQAKAAKAMLAGLAVI